LDPTVGAKLIDLGQQQGLFEGDIRMPKRAGRNGILPVERWPNNTIYYEYGEKLDWNQDQIDMVQGAIKEIQDNTCIKFVKRTNQRNYISMFNGAGCSTAVGFMNSGAQLLSLQESGRGSCWSHRIVLHELLHTVGLWHEQSRYDRDDYLSINLDNVEFCQRYNFDIQHSNASNTYGVPFNYLSIMHYGKTSFSMNGGITMTTKDPNFMDEIGNQKKGAASDYDKVNRIYQCGAYKNFVPPPIKLATSASTSNKGVCVNVDCYDDCPSFDKNMNYCQVQPEYMRQWCPKTCNSCSPTNVTPAAPTPPTPTPSACKDNEAECAKLAADGNCKAGNGWTEYMTRSCPKSCGLCSASTCTDKVKDEGLCDAWASVGYCAQLSVQNDCAKTCGKC